MQGARRLVIFLWIGCCWIEPIVRQYANSSSSRRCSTTNNRKEYTWSTALNKTMFWVKGNNFWTQSLCSYMDIAVWNLSKNWESLCRCFFCLSFLLLLQNLFSFHLFAYVYSIASPQYMPQHILGTYLLLFFTVFSFLPCSTIYYISDCIIPPYLILTCVCVCASDVPVPFVQILSCGEYFACDAMRMSEINKSRAHQNYSFEAVYVVNIVGCAVRRAIQL